MHFYEKFDIDDTGNFIAVGAREEDGIEDNGSVKSKSGSLRVYEYKIPTSTEWSNADIYKDSDSNQVSGKFYWTQVGNHFNIIYFLFYNLKLPIFIHFIYIMF